MKIFEFIKQKVLHLLNLEPAEFEIYDAKSFGDKKKYIKNYECTNKWKEKWQSVKRNIGYFKEFDQTQWEKLLNLHIAELIGRVCEAKRPHSVSERPARALS